MGEYKYDDGIEFLTVILIEPGDTIESLDAEMNGQFLTNHYSGRSFGQLTSFDGNGDSGQSLMPTTAGATLRCP